MYVRLCDFDIHIEKMAKRFANRADPYQTPQKIENFQIKNSDIFHISAQNIDCGYSLEPPRRGGSNAYPQSMFF